MKTKELLNFLENALDDPALCWKPEELQRIGYLLVPEQVFGEYPALLRGDIHRLWAEWFLGAFVDVNRFAVGEVSYANIYKSVREFCLSALGTKPPVGHLAKVIARLADEEVTRLKRSAKRKGLPIDDRQLMVDLADGRPRCWVCGYRFAEEAIENFLKGKFQHELPAPLLVDIFKPIGLTSRDMQIEVDHVFPFSRGGGDEENLRIACGWCNRHKSNYASLYDTAGVDRVGKTKSGYYSLPQPLWVVRLLALSGASEYSGKTARDCELTVTLRNPNGKATPPNLVVVSSEGEIPSEQLQNWESALRIIKKPE